MTLQTDTVKNSTGTKSISTDTVIDGSAKARALVDGTGTPSTSASFNIASIVDNGTGDFTLNVTSAFATADYEIVGGAGRGVAGGNIAFVTSPWTVDPTVTASRYNTVATSSLNPTDLTHTSVAMFGDLA